MIKLETQFVSGEGGFSAEPLTYTQVIRNEKFAVYERSRDGKVKDYEVIKIQILKKGLKIFLKTIEEDTEKYCSTSQFGQFGWSFTGTYAKDAALAKFEALSNPVAEIVKPAKPVKVKGGKKGRAKIERPNLLIPTGRQFTMSELIDSNPAPWTKILITNDLQKMIKSGTVKLVGKAEKVAGKRGKAASLYSLS